MSSISIQFGDDPLPPPPAPKTTSIASFFVKEQTKIEPELSAEEQKKLDDDWNIKMTEKEDRKALRVSVLAQACKAWQIPAITEPRPWGTKKKSVMWDDKLRDFLASEYNALRLDATTVIGTKPVMPENWNPKDPSVVLRLPPQTVSDSSTSTSSESSSTLPQPCEIKTPKRGTYLKLDDESKYAFFDLHRSLKHSAYQETVDWVLTHLPTIYNGVNRNKVLKWIGLGFGKRPTGTSGAATDETVTKAKRGSKAGAVAEWQD